MQIEEFFPYVLPSDIPEAYQPVIKMVGIDGFLKLCQYCMGDEIYFPMTDTIIRKARNRMICQDYDGYNVKALSKKYGITTSQVKNILKAQTAQNKIKADK